MTSSSALRGYFPVLLAELLKSLLKSWRCVVVVHVDPAAVTARLPTDGVTNPAADRTSIELPIETVASMFRAFIVQREVE
jgi:hypothetical protein